MINNLYQHQIGRSQKLGIAHAPLHTDTTQTARADSDSRRLFSVRGGRGSSNVMVIIDIMTSFKDNIYPSVKKSTGMSSQRQKATRKAATFL